MAAAAARRGLDVLVLERRALPADKACGEGLLPGAVRALARLEARALLDPAATHPLLAIRWRDGPFLAEAALPPPGGLGVRRLALSAALLARARALGAEVRDRTSILHHRRDAREVRVTTDVGTERGELLVAADGLASPIRRREGL